MYQQAPPLKAVSRFEIRGLQYVQGTAYTGYRAALFVDGLRVAYAYNDGCDEDPSNPWVHVFNQELLVEAIAPITKSYPGFWFWQNEDGSFMVCALRDQVERIITYLADCQNWRERCKGVTLFALSDINYGEFEIIERAYSQELAQQIRDRYGDRLIEILNERYL